MHPLITVVTVCYNSEKSIRKTIESVLNQDLSEAEYLIIDGASKDHTLEIIEEYKDAFHGLLRVISEPDNGWYDAMNKGIRHANGDFVVFLNSDDYFDENALEIVKNAIKRHKIGTDSIIYGDSTNIYMNSKGDVLFRRINAPDKIGKNDKGLRDGMCGIRHQSMFTGKDVFKKVGNLDLQYRLHADWDFLIKCLYQDIPMFHIKENLTFYSMYGVSTKPHYEERHQLRSKNGLYHSIDLYYLKDRCGIKAIAKKVLGEKRWNDVLFNIHRFHDRRQ